MTTPDDALPWLDETLQSFLTTALWANVCDSLEPEDIPDYERKLAREAVSAFLTTFHEDALAAIDERDAEALGHDLYLTSRRHGAGFWDGDWSNDLGNRLTEAAHTLSECDDLDLWLYDNSDERENDEDED